MASFPQPRPRMPQANPDEALRALRSMQSMTNVSGLPDEGLDIAQGLGDFQPSEAELMDAQLSGPMGISREQIRKGAMQKVKQMLRLKGAEHAEKMDLAGEKTRAEAEARAAQNEAIAARQREMTEMQGAERAASREDAQAHAAQLQAERLAAQRGAGGTTNQQQPTADMDKRLQESRGAYMSPIAPLNPVRKFLGMSPYGREGFTGALEAVRQRMGVRPELAQAAVESLDEGLTAEQAIAQAQTQGVELSPAEQSFLRYAMGR